jgi:transcriptional regulator with XRE-family HTH domain
VTSDFADELRRRRAERGLSIRVLAELVHYGKSYVHELETGLKLPTTLRRLEHVTDQLAMAYATTAPAELLPRVRRHLEYVSSLLGARKTLEPQRRLITAGGWLALCR